MENRLASAIERGKGIKDATVRKLLDPEKELHTNGGLYQYAIRVLTHAEPYNRGIMFDYQWMFDSNCDSNGGRPLRTFADSCGMKVLEIVSSVVVGGRPRCLTVELENR
jgi:hypothetical protein